MELYLDEEALEVIEPAETPLRTVLERLSQDLHGKGRVICEVVVDGHYEGDWEREEFANRPVGELGSVRLKSEQPRRLAVRTLYDIVGYMPKVKDALVSVSAKLQSRQEEEALQLLADVSTTWLELTRGFQRAAQVVGIELGEINVVPADAEGDSPKSAESIQNDIQDMLEQAADHLDTQNFLELSDLLEYELAPLIPHLEESIYMVIREAERKLN